MRRKDIYCWFERSAVGAGNSPVGLIRDYKTINHRLTPAAPQCYEWIVDSGMGLPVYQGLEHLTHRHLTENTLFVCVDDRQRLKNQIVLFQDDRNDPAYPKEFVIVPCCTSTDELIAVLTQKGLLRFTLKDKTKFERYQGAGPIKGANVYKEISTGHYWHLDTLHLTHYEVYDATRRHIYEADLAGVAIPGSKDNNKRLP